MKLLFVDHKFHEKTKSSNFFLELLRKHFEVEVEYVDVEHQDEVQALNGPRLHDLVVIWQLDFLAPAFLAAGYPTVVVPMFDGSANMPYEHWVAMHDASFICFSRTLHERITAAGCRSYLVKYFLPPCHESQLPKFDQLHGILWMRRPQDGLTPRLIEHMLGSQITSLHVHNAPDDGKPRLLTDPSYRVTAFPVNESRWSASSNGYLTALKEANVFFAPRTSEGIGMAMLEAFANGQLVIANDDAVHNEYVANWVNGILFNRSNVSPFHLNLQTAKELAYAGWYGAVVGYQEWCDTQTALIEFVKETRLNTGRESTTDHGFVSALWSAYLLGVDAYRHFLRRHVVNMDHYRSGRRVAAPIVSLLKSDSDAMPVLDADGLFFGMSSRSVAKGYGFDQFDAFSARLSSQTAGFSVAHHEYSGVDSKVALSITCFIEKELDDDWIVVAHVNQAFASSEIIPRKPGEYLLNLHVSENKNNDLHVMLTFLPAKPNPSIATNNLPAIRFFSVRIQSGGLRDS